MDSKCVDSFVKDSRVLIRKTATTSVSSIGKRVTATTRHWPSQVLAQKQWPAWLFWNRRSLQPLRCATSALLLQSHAYSATHSVLRDVGARTPHRGRFSCLPCQFCCTSVPIRPRSFSLRIPGWEPCTEKILGLLDIDNIACEDYTLVPTCEP